MKELLSRLDFYPKHYKIIKKDNKIYIKYNDETFRKNSNIILEQKNIK